MMASTARMTAPAPSGKRGRSSLSGRNYLIRPLEIAPATGADLHVDRLQLPALGAGAPRLAVLGAVEDRRQRAEQRQHRPDQEPDPERAALELADHRGRKTAEERQNDELHAPSQRSAPTAQ